MATIRNARLDDLEAIISIAESRKYNSNSKIAQSSFIMRSYTHEELLAFIGNQEVIVVESATTIVAYVIYSTSISLGNENKHINAIMLHTDDTDFLFIIQVATRIDEENKGYGLDLYDYIIGLAANKPIYANSMLSPANADALHFHKITGFQVIFNSADFEDGGHRIYFRKLPYNTNSNDPLLKQFETARDLYRHEEDLNWRKISTLFYVNVGLGALLAILLREGTKWSLNVLLGVAVISMLGMLITHAFGTSLRSGVGQVRRRKSAMMRIDRQLSNQTGQITIIDKSFAPTLSLLEWSPKVLTALWIVTLLLASGFAAFTILLAQ